VHHPLRPRLRRQQLVHVRLPLSAYFVFVAGFFLFVAGFFLFDVFIFSSFGFGLKCSGTSS
jgi:hypothetical protein